MWQFILSGCLLFRPNVLTRQCLVYDGSRQLSAHLIPSAAGGRGGDCAQPGVEVLLPKVISLGTDRSDVFLETWWALCILSRTGTFLDLERTAAKSAGQAIHLTSGKVGLTVAKNPVCLLPHRIEGSRVHLEEMSVVYHHCCFPQKKRLWENGTQPFSCCIIA